MRNRLARFVDRLDQLLEIREDYGLDYDIDYIENHLVIVVYDTASREWLRRRIPIDEIMELNAPEEGADIAVTSMIEELSLICGQKEAE